MTTEKLLRTLMGLEQINEGDLQDNEGIKVELLKDKDRNNKFLGRAIVEFPDEEKAAKAKGEGEKVGRVDGRPVRIEYVFDKEFVAPILAEKEEKNETENVQLHQLFLKYLPVVAKERDMRDLFKNEKIEQPTKIKLYPDPENEGMNKGIAFISYICGDAAYNALEGLNGLAWWGKHIECSWAKKR